MPADAAPEHLQGCLQTTSNSGTEARTQESFPPPSPSLPTLLLGLICTDLPRRLLSDLPWPWQSCGQGGGAAGGWRGAACRGWGGRWGEGQANRSPACQKQFRPRNSFNARRRSRLGAKPAGLEENVLGRQRGTRVWGWVREQLGAGSSHQPSPPWGGVGSPGCKNSPPGITFSHQHTMGRVPGWLSAALIIYLLQPVP